jgi:hypothetical protein
MCAVVIVIFEVCNSVRLPSLFVDTCVGVSIILSSMNYRMKSSVLLDVTLYSPIQVHRGETHCLHFQGRRVSQASWLLCLLLDPENGDSIFLRNVGELPLDYTA